jgi:hypothetical protein
MILDMELLHQVQNTMLPQLAPPTLQCVFQLLKYIELFTWWENVWKLSNLAKIIQKIH